MCYKIFTLILGANWEQLNLHPKFHRTLGVCEVISHKSQMQDLLYCTEFQARQYQQNTIISIIKYIKVKR